MLAIPSTVSPWLTSVKVVVAIVDAVNLGIDLGFLEMLYCASDPAIERSPLVKIVAELGI